MKNVEPSIVLRMQPMAGDETKYLEIMKFYMLRDFGNFIDHDP